VSSFVSVLDRDARETPGTDEKKEKKEFKCNRLKRDIKKRCEKTKVCKTKQERIAMRCSTQKEQRQKRCKKRQVKLATRCIKQKEKRQKRCQTKKERYKNKCRKRKNKGPRNKNNQL